MVAESETASRPTDAEVMFDTEVPEQAERGAGRCWRTTVRSGGVCDANGSILRQSLRPKLFSSSEAGCGCRNSSLVESSARLAMRTGLVVAAQRTACSEADPASCAGPAHER